MDAALQFGRPSLFITVSPYEWTFPFPPWLKLTCKIRSRPNKFETMHIVKFFNKLFQDIYVDPIPSDGQIIYLTTTDKNQTNVLTYFYRFEFQDRGTVHLHMLVWLKDMTKMKLDAIRADIPWQNKSLAQQVLDLQASDKQAVPLFEHN